ncbi:MAG TPA: hypothetical protein VGG39_26195 [Polyangiaceae bacterium]
MVGAAAAALACHAPASISTGDAGAGAGAGAEEATPTPTCVDTLDARLAEAHTLYPGPLRTAVVDATFLYVDVDRSPFFDDAVALAPRVLAALRNGRIAPHPLCPVTVYVFGSRARFEQHCSDHRYVPDGTRNWGVWDPLRRDVVVDLSGGRAHVPTTAHELTHVVMLADFEAPRWFRECVGTLYEAPVFPRDGDIAGEDNWRYGALRTAVAAHDPRAHLGALFGMSDLAFRGDSASTSALNEAMARATCQWLDERGALWPFYRAWRDARADAGDLDGVAAFRRIRGQTPAEADPDWRAWVLRRGG